MYDPTAELFVFLVFIAALLGVLTVLAWISDYWDRIDKAVRWLRGKK